MNISSVKLIYFSPTGTTKSVLEAIAEGMGVDDVQHMNMTLPDSDSKPAAGLTDEVVVIGAPVYGGRLPADAAARLKRLSVRNTPAVLVVVYGNREYEDALLELTDLSKELGFIPVCGAAFIGEHSFHTKDLPIAGGRPDGEDIDQARSFGAAVTEKLSKIQSLDDLPSLKVPGNFPYKEAMPPHPVAPTWLSDKCTLCGVCVDLCPTNAITMDATVETDPQSCIKCCACIKGCPEEARIMEDQFLLQIAKQLHENCSQRKAPQLFL